MGCEKGGCSAVVAVTVPMLIVVVVVVVDSTKSINSSFQSVNEDYHACTGLSPPGS